jgi:predicted nucleic acid-binding protein
LKAALIADTGGLLRALARRVNGNPSWPDYEKALRDASTVFVPSLVLPEIDYFLRTERSAMRRFIAELFDPGTRYQFEQVHAADIARAMQLDAKFHERRLGLVDCGVAALAERLGVFRILTTDRGDFSVLRIGLHCQRALELVP